MERSDGRCPHADHVWMFASYAGGAHVRTEQSVDGWLVSLLKPLTPGFLTTSLEAWLLALKTRAEAAGR